MGPTTMLLVRHGESEGNIAASAAHAAGAESIAVPARDADVNLSALGLEQARALGRWLADLPDASRPGAVWSSPYARALQTARTALDTAGVDLEVRIDERLRDRELGVLDALTARGVDVRMPFEAERRRWLGKFYYRPPGGESWADVALRLRSFLADLERLDPGETVLLVCHDAPIMITRYVCELLTESQVLEIGRTSVIGNGSVTRLTREPGGHRWAVRDFAAADHLLEQGVPATAHQGTVDEQH